MTVAEFFRAESRKGLEQRLAHVLDPAADDFDELRKPYDERLEIELDVIINMGFPGYFLIVADFIQWAKDNRVPVGPGRGSGAGSLVAYVMKITDLDPLEYELLFERFLNPERVSMPDFDVDFCMEGRDRVIDYVARTTAGKSLADHHLRHHGCQGGGARRGARAGASLRFRRPGRQDGAVRDRHDADKALSESEELKQAYERDEEVTAAHRHGRSTGRPGAKRR